jgi:hypothetical protein
MGVSVLCDSCGNRFDAGDTGRRKVRCPDCGVMCTVPEADERPAPKKTAPEVDADELARQVFDEPEEEPKKPAPKQPVPAARKEPPAELVENVTPRPRVQTLDDEAPKRGARQWTDEDDDDSAYEMAGGELRKCPECSKIIEPEAVVCVGCGYDLLKRKKHTRTFEPIKRRWEPGMSWSNRFRVFVAASVVGAFCAWVMAVSILGEAGPAVSAWFGTTAMLAFLIGTFFRLDVERDRRGRARLWRTWYVFFVETRPQEIDLDSYNQFIRGRSTDSGFFEWWIFFQLLLYGLVPGLFWWYYIIRPIKCHLALARDHGYPEIILYRGGNQQYMEELAATLRDATRLPYERA